MRFEAFMVTEFNEVFFGNQQCQYGMTFQCFGDFLPPSSGTDVLGII